MMSSLTQRIFPEVKSRSGFTIVELLVATAVTAVLAGILLTMTNSVLRAWNGTTGALSTNSEAQLIFDLLEEDLESAVYRNDFGVWMAVEVLEDTTSVGGRKWTLFSQTGFWKPDTAISEYREDPSGNELPLDETRYGLGGSWLRFFTTAGHAEPRVVAYQLARRKITGDPEDTANLAEVRYMLYRSEIDPTNTLERGFNLDTNPFPPFPAPPAGYTVPGNALIAPPMAEVIGNNVIDFGIRLYVRRGTNLLPIFPVNASNVWDNSHIEYFARGTASEPFPDVVDVMVRILTNEGAEMIQNLEEGRIPPEGGDFEEAWWAIAEEHSRVFTHRIHVNAKPL